MSNDEPDYMIPKHGPDYFEGSEYIPDEAEELFEDLLQLGYEVELFNCRKAIDIMKTDSKNAAAEFLKSLGVEIVKKTETMNCHKFDKWCVDGITIMCG